MRGQQFAALALCVFPGLMAAQDQFIQFRTYTQEEDEKILKLYEPLRVADVSDGLDMVGLQDVGLMDPAIRPLWRDTDEMRHKFAGIAVTVRYLPTNRRVGKMTPDEFRKWEGDWYGKLSPEPFTKYLRKGSVVVIDGGEDGDTGTIGSNNILGWKTRGAVGVVTSGGARDTDEVIKQQVPLYYKRPARGIRPGRNEVESVNRPIMCGGVMVRPGDVIVADGDGVVVVPREVAEEVAKLAYIILEGDKEGRRKLYEKLGMSPDQTVK
ncbi:MAG: RraA family protein [Bryobacteraceae bacterium]|nr:RraA family protein [Bryobacteraceae bacterium]